MKRYGVWWLFALVLLLAPTVFDSSLSRTLLSQMGIAIIVCLSFNMLLGQGGMLSFGHAVYSGMGGFLAIHTLNLVSDGQWWLPVSLIPVAGGLGAALVAVLLGWVTTKKAATPFAMITLGVGELVWAMSLMFPVFFWWRGWHQWQPRHPCHNLWHQLWASNSAVLPHSCLHFCVHSVDVRLHLHTTRADAQCHPRQPRAG